MTRAVLVGAALLSPFLFPPLLTLGLALIASLFLPSAALFAGILLDLTHYTYGAGIPWGTLIGLVIFLGAFVVRSFVRERMLFPHA